MAGVVLAVLLLRVGVVLAVHGAHPERSIVDDTPSYVDPARALVEDGDFDRSPDSSTPEFIRTPGYPAFIAAVHRVFGESDMAVVVTQAALSGLSVLLAMVVARRLSGSAAIALAVGVMLALDPLQAAWAGLIMSETLATLLVTLTVYCAVRLVQSGFSVRWGALGALALVAATYVRPTTYYFPILVGVLLLALVLRNPGSRTTLVRGSAAFLVPCVVLLGAWNLRNHSEVGSWRFSGIEEVNTYWYRAAAVVAARDGTSLERARLELTEQLSQGLVPEFDYEDYAHGTLPPVWEDRQGEYYDRAQRSGFEILRSEPLLTARQVVRGIYSQFVQSGWGDALEFFTGSSEPSIVVALSLVPIWSIEALGLLGMVVSLRDRRPGRAAHVLTIALAAYTIVVSAGPEAAAGFRFRIPIWSIWCLYAAIGARHIGRWTKDRRARRASPDSGQGNLRYPEDSLPRTVVRSVQPAPVLPPARSPIRQRMRLT